MYEVIRNCPEWQTEGEAGSFSFEYKVCFRQSTSLLPQIHIRITPSATRKWLPVQSTPTLFRTNCLHQKYHDTIRLFGGQNEFSLAKPTDMYTSAYVNRTISILTFDLYFTFLFKRNALTIVGNFQPLFLWRLNETMLIRANTAATVNKCNVLYLNNHCRYNSWWKVVDLCHLHSCLRGYTWL